MLPGREGRTRKGKAKCEEKRGKGKERREGRRGEERKRKEGCSLLLY